MAWRFVFVVVFVLSSFVSPSAACPESCHCFDDFVSCAYFNLIDLALLPPNTNTLILSNGEVEEIPPNFLAMARNLKMLEINNLSARVIRGRAFRGLSNLDLFSIASSTFDIVEPDGFNGLSHIGQLHIYNTTFGRVGKHAFADINDISEIRIWSSIFKTISDEAFTKLVDIITFQLYKNNITYIGSKVFSQASGIDTANIYQNRFETISEGGIESIAAAAGRIDLFANTFLCSCDIAWMLENTVIRKFLSNNECTFGGHTQFEDSTFRLSDITKESLCSTVPSTAAVETVPAESTLPTSITDDSTKAVTTATETSDLQTPDILSIGITETLDLETSDILATDPTETLDVTTSDILDVTEKTVESRTSVLMTKLSTAPVHPQVSIESRQDSTTFTAFSTSSDVPSITSSSEQDSAEVSELSESSATSSKSPRLSSQESNEQDAAMGNSPVTEEVGAIDASSESSQSTIGRVTEEASVARVKVDVFVNNNYGKPYSTSAIGMSTMHPHSSAGAAVGNLVSVLVLCGLAYLFARFQYT